MIKMITASEPVWDHPTVVVVHIREKSRSRTVDKAQNSRVFAMPSHGPCPWILKYIFSSSEIIGSFLYSIIWPFEWRVFIGFLWLGQRSERWPWTLSSEDIIMVYWDIVRWGNTGFDYVFCGIGMTWRWPRKRNRRGEQKGSFQINFCPRAMACAFVDSRGWWWRARRGCE